MLRFKKSSNVSFGYLLFISLVLSQIASAYANNQTQDKNAADNHNKHSQHSLDRFWGMPSTSNSHLMGAPESKSLEEVIALIEAVENAYPNDNWKVIAVRLRKTHYNSDLWDLFLVGSIDIKPADVEQGVPPSVIDTLKKGNIIFKDPNGNAIDVTHIWALINALSYPSIDAGIDDLSGISVADSISWVGDVGSVVSEYTLKTRPHFDSLEQYFHGYSSGSDLYGDIDGYGIFHQEVDDNLPLSARIKTYYQDNFNNRFGYYEKATNIKFENNDNIFSVSGASVKNIIEPKVKQFASFWTLHLCKSSDLKCIVDDIDKKFYSGADVKTVVSLYSAWMEAQLAEASRKIEKVSNE